MASNTITVNILGDANDLKKALGQADSGLSQFAAKAKHVGDQATSIGRSMTLGVTLPLVGLGKVAFNELQQSAAASAQTEAAIKSTGGAAHVSAKQVDELATSLLNKSGIDDEVVKGGENVLLTFRGIRNEAGKGNDIFNQATKATLDLSVAFGKDMTSSAILVGKALQDPIQGVTALRRVGVQLSDSQVDLIKSLVASGDTMGAQKVILKELTTEIGGSAAAYGNSFAGQVSKATEQLKNAGAAILTAFIPALKGIASFAIDASHAFLGLPQPVQTAAVAFAALLAAVGPAAYVFGAFAKFASGVAQTIQAIGSVAQTAAIEFLYFVDAIKAAGVAQIALGVGLVAAVAAIGALIVVLGSSDGPFERIQAAAEKWGKTTINAAKSSGDEYKSLSTTSQALAAHIEDLKDTQQRYSDAISSGQPGAQNYREALNQVSEALTVAQERHKALAPEIARLKGEMEAAKSAEAGRKQGLADLAAGTTNLTTATNEARQAIQDLQSATLAAAGGELGLQQAKLNLTKAQQDYNTAIAEHGPLSAEATEAGLNLQQARLGVAAATINAQDAEDNLIAIVRQGPEAVAAEINKLKDIIRVRGDDSGAIQQQIDKLFFLSLSINGIHSPPPVNVDINVGGIAELTYALSLLDTLDGKYARAYAEVVPVGVNGIQQLL